MSQDWYYSVDGDRQGPITSAELKKLAEAGTLGPADLVWKDGMADWVAAKSIKGLFGATSPGTGTSTPTASKSGEQPSAGSRAAAAMNDDRPSARAKPRGDDEEERPSRSKRRPVDEEEEEERPSRRGRRNVDEDEDERPSRAAARRRNVDDDEEDVRPSRKSRRGGRVPQDTGSKKMTAGILALLIGGFGVHKFYLGMTTPGILQIVISVCTCGLGGVIPFIEGIIYLTKSDEDFHQMYVVEQKGWF